MTSSYPGSIDGYSEIRVVRNRIDEIVQDDHNDLRSAVLAIERTLGVNPQGSFGTVVSRLNDAYNNIEGHVLGNPPRHQDNIIMSPLRSGTIPSSPETLPYSLSEGPLADQIEKILEYLNDSLVYYGSSPSTFADGYALPVSLARQAITQIVAQLGGNTGTTKIKGGALTSSNFGNIALGGLKDQLQGLLSLIDDFGDSTGAGTVGTSSFYSPLNKYQFTGSYVQDQLEETGNFLDEGASFRERAFNSFVVEGMSVTQNGGGPDATVAGGYFTSNGRLLKYSGGNITVSTTPGTYYIYAKISSGSVSVASSSNLSTIFDPINPSVLLHKIIHSGGAWSTSIDLRRFGVFINDKNYISVGNTPSSGKDGYGCDFTSLKSAVEYAKTINSSNEFIPPLKIILVSDINITSSSEMEIQLDIDGIQIDGCGRKVTTSVDTSLFNIEADNVTIRDIVLESNLSVSGSSQCLAHIGNSNSINNITINNCKVLQTGGTACTYFLRLGNSGATTTISNSIISENIAEVEKGGIEYVSTNKYATVLRDSIILGNNIYQNTFSSTSYAGIKASIHCTLGDNIIKGGFDTGILLAFPNQCRVDGNLIIGYDSAVIYMNNGIAIWDNVTGQDNGCVISDNTIKGIANYGINCRAGVDSGAFISVYGNFIDNFYDVGTPSSSMVGIKGGGDETWIVGNKITAPGTYGIENCSHAVGNQIYGSSSITGTTSAIKVATSSSGVISENVIKEISGIGIDLADNSNIIVSSNILIGYANSTSALYDIGSYSIISNNYIKSYRGSYSLEIVSSNYDILISGNRFDYLSATFGIFYCPSGCFGISITNNYIQGCQEKGFEFSGSNTILFSSNFMSGYLGSNAVNNFGNNSIIIGNNILSYCYSSSDTAIYADSGSTDCVIVGNQVTGCNGICIQANSGNNFIISNNYLESNSSGDFGKHSISSVGDNSIVNGNLIINSNFISIVNGGDNVVCNNNIIENPSYIGITSSGSFNIINGNFINSSSSYGIETSGSECLITSNYINESGNYSIYINGSIRCLISSNYIRNSTNVSILVDSSNQCNIVGNYVLDSLVNGILIDTSNQVNVSSNYIYSAGENAIKTTAASVDISIIANYIYNPVANGVELSSTGPIVNNNWIRNPGETGVLAQASATYATIQNNYIWSPGNEGIRGESGANELFITGNMIRNASDSGIYLEGNILSSIVGNYIYEPVNFGIILANSNGSNINGNWIFSPDSSGVSVTGNSSRCIVNSNWIRDSVDSGIWIGPVAFECVIVGNFLSRCGSNGNPQIDLDSADDWVCVGNNINTPMNNSSDGIAMSSSDGGLCVGNRAVGGGSAKGIDYTSATNYVIEGNMSRGGTNPGGFAGLPLLGNDNGFKV